MFRLDNMKNVVCGAIGWEGGCAKIYVFHLSWLAEHVGWSFTRHIVTGWPELASLDPADLEFSGTRGASQHTPRMAKSMLFFIYLSRHEWKGFPVGQAPSFQETWSFQNIRGYLLWSCSFSRGRDIEIACCGSNSLHVDQNTTSGRPWACQERNV